MQHYIYYAVSYGESLAVQDRVTHCVMSVHLSVPFRLVIFGTAMKLTVICVYD